MLKVNEYGERQATGNEKNLCFKGWETLVNLFAYYRAFLVKISAFYNAYSLKLETKPMDK